ncbi:minor tail protein [Gordonia phage LilyPad]|nr:minor tail protein [Gordonia phage LilyPad]
MAESNSREVFFLKQIAQQKYNKDFAVNMVQVNNTLTSLSKYLIVMQQGIDDLNRDIVEQIRDFIRELIIIFNGGDFAELGLDFGHLKYVFRAIGEFFGFNIWGSSDGSGTPWTPLQMVGNFFNNFLSGLSDFGTFIHNAFDSAIDFVLSLVSWIPGVGGNARQRLAGALNTAKGEAEYAAGVADSANTVAITTTYNVSSNKPLHETPDPTGQGSLRWADVAWYPGASPPATTVTTGLSRIGKLRIQSDQVMNTVVFQAWQSSPNQFLADLYRFDWDLQKWIRLATSPDLSPQIGTTPQFVVWKFSEDGHPVAAGELYAVQFRAWSTTSMLAKQFPASWIPGFEPEMMGASRAVRDAPAEFTNAQMDSLNDPIVPYFFMGADLGQVDSLRSWYINFDNSSWQNWVRTTGDGALKIENGRVKYSGTTDGAQEALYGSQTATDKMEIQFNVYNTKTLAPVGAWICGISTDLSYSSPTVAGMQVYASNLIIYLDGVVKASNGSAGGDGSYRFRYEPETNTFRILKLISGQWVSQLSYVDSSNLATHGPGHRYAGIYIGRSTFTNGGEIDDVYIRDWRE